MLERKQFFLLAAKLPPLYLTRGEHISGYTLLMPGIPVACGTLPDIDCRLGSVDGNPALLTDLDPTQLSIYDRLRLVVVEQLAFPGQLKLVGIPGARGTATRRRLIRRAHRRLRKANTARGRWGSRRSSRR